MSEELLELATRCEAASGPDRELDGSIWWATRSPDAIENYDRTGYVRECIERDGSAGKALNQFFDSANPYCLARLAFEATYTASLDAAMTLVPEGVGLNIGRYWIASSDGPVWSADIATGGIPSKPRQVFDCYDAATPALALCASALRVRAAITKATPPQAQAPTTRLPLEG